MSYRLDERFSFDLGYTFVTAEDADIRAANAGGPDANGPFSGHADAHSHYISAAIKVKLLKRRVIAQTTSAGSAAVDRWQARRPLPLRRCGADCKIAARCLGGAPVRLAFHCSASTR